MLPLNHSSNPKSNANAHGSTVRRMQGTLDPPLYQFRILASDLGYRQLITT
jgi:starvation-inducible outer membrane lipoprotein